MQSIDETTASHVRSASANLKRALSLHTWHRETHPSPQSKLVTLATEAGRLAGLTGYTYSAWLALAPDALAVETIAAAFREGWFAPALEVR